MPQESVGSLTATPTSITSVDGAVGLVLCFWTGLHCRQDSNGWMSVVAPEHYQKRF